MAAKLKDITTTYHTFEDNQVLTKDQLNEFINYFDDQDRLSRVSLSGVGIVCGFCVKINSTKSKITISQGAGVTTDGDLIKLQKEIPKSTGKSISIKQIEYTHFKEFEDSFSNYNFFKKSVVINGRNHKKDIRLLELFPDKEEGAKPLGKLQNVEKLIVLLYVESYAKKGDLCTTIDCDNQGTEQVARLRILLVSETDAEFIANSDPVFSWHNIAKKYTELPEIKLLRVNLTNANNINSLKQSFVNAVSQQILTKLKEGLKSIFEIFNKPLVSNKIDELFDFIESSTVVPFDFQYRFDLLADLIATYNEIKQILLQINVECCPNIGSFPKHILLGKIIEKKEYKTFRHRFYKSPISETEDTNYKTVLSLINKTTQIANNFITEQKVESIRITPSHLSGKLSDKTIPYYYKLNNRFLDFWSFLKFQNLKEKYNLSYHFEKLADKPEVRKPLLFNIDNYDFFRIEGHLGLRALESRDEIISRRNTHSLNFDCIVLELESDVQSFTGFVKKYPPLEHKAGVEKGGTFILVSVDDKIVADFCLPYKIAAKVAEQNCCSLMECTYPWISSLKYLNNLARGTKGTQSRNKPMPQEYRLQVVEYKINGQSLINRTTTLSIPLKEIFLRRVHAITEALNNRFDKGVIFDFNESQKRFVITRAKEDTYTIRFKDATMAVNNPVYTYSNKGMFRNNKIFRPDAMRCRDLRKYNPSFYEKLHDKIAPVGKDDDNGTFNEKWRKWNLLKAALINNEIIRKFKLKRMITKVNDLPQEIQAELRTFKVDFQNVDSTIDLQFKLDGDWVTGEWVNKNMLDHHRKNKKNTHDNIVLFINLRKYLHSETGVTKLSIYVTNHEYSSQFDAVIEKYNQLADIYFGTPLGENAIQI